MTSDTRLVCPLDKINRRGKHGQWLLVTRIEGTHREFDAAQMAQVPKDKLLVFEELVAREARNGFQYRFERHLLYDNLRAGKLPTGPLRTPPG